MQLNMGGQETRGIRLDWMLSATVSDVSFSVLNCSAINSL